MPCKEVAVWRWVLGHCLSTEKDGCRNVCCSPKMKPGLDGHNLFCQWQAFKMHLPLDIIWFSAASKGEG